MLTARHTITQTLSGLTPPRQIKNLGDVLGTIATAVSGAFSKSLKDGCQSSVQLKLPNDESVLDYSKLSTPLKVMKGPEELKMLLQQSVNRVRMALQLDEAAAGALLVAHDFSAERAIEAYAEDQDGGL